MASWSCSLAFSSWTGPLTARNRGCWLWTVRKLSAWLARKGISTWPNSRLPHWLLNLDLFCARNSSTSTFLKPFSLWEYYSDFLFFSISLIIMAGNSPLSWPGPVHVLGWHYSYQPPIFIWQLRACFLQVQDHRHQLK